MARCADCNGFVSLDLADEVEVDNVEIEVNEDDDGLPVEARVSCTARIVRTCAECGSELQESTCDLEGNVKIPEAHHGEGHDPDVEEGTAEATEERKGSKKMFGAAVELIVSCSCGETVETVKLVNSVAASDMEEIG